MNIDTNTLIFIALAMTTVCVRQCRHWGIGLVKAAMHWYMAARKQG